MTENFSVNPQIKKGFILLFSSSVNDLSRTKIKALIEYPIHQLTTNLETSSEMNPS